MDVQLKMFGKYENIHEQFKNNTIDAAFLGSFAATLAILQLKAEPLVRPVNLDGTSTYHAVIFTRKDSGVLKAEDMRNKTFAFVGKASTAGYVYPCAYFKRHGIEDYTTYLKDYFFAGSHDATIDAVIKKQADIGASKNTIYNYYLSTNPQAAEQLIVLARSAPVPSNGLCVRPTLDNILKDKIQNELLGLDKTSEGQSVLKTLRAYKFVKTGEHDYKPVMGMSRIAGIDLENFHFEKQDPSAE